MKAAVVHELGKPPVFGAFEDPIPSDGEVTVAVTASALTNFTKVRAAGKHFSFAAKPPFVAGIDGIGRLEDGRRVYFLFPRIPYGGIAEETVVPLSHCIDLPPGVDDITLAAIADPGMSAWAALERRAKMVPGETVLVNGATGAAGTIAVQVAKHLGAKKVIATGRNTQALEGLASLGADEAIVLEGAGPVLDAALNAQFEEGVDVVLDYLWGPSAERILAATRAAKAATPLRFVQIGTASAPAITLPGMVLRSAAIDLMGSGIGTIPLQEIMAIMSNLIRASPAIRFKINTAVLPLARVGDVWFNDGANPRIVFAPGS